jgi:hypothetical protein
MSFQDDQQYIALDYLPLNPIDVSMLTIEIQRQIHFWAA